jgi:hypothetical protein
MKILGVQYDKISGPDALRSYKLTFTVDESQASALKDFFDVKKGTEFIAFLHEANEEEIDEMSAETDEQTRNRYMKRVYSCIHDISANRKIDDSEVKKKLKEYLKKKKYITKSMSELDTRGLAAAVYYLENEFFNK